MVDLFLEAHATPPQEIWLDLDATDDPLHGHQEGRFFHGYYDCYCYLPLYIRCRPWRAKRGPVVPDRRRRGCLAVDATERERRRANKKRIRHAVKSLWEP